MRSLSLIGFLAISLCATEAHPATRIKQRAGVNSKRPASTAPAATKPPADVRKAAQLIVAEQLKNYLSFVAADELEGRGTPSRGLDIAAKFIATNLSRLGLRPAGDNGTYFQRIPLERYKADSAKAAADSSGAPRGVAGQAIKQGDVAPASASATTDGSAPPGQKINRPPVVTLSTNQVSLTAEDSSGAVTTQNVVAILEGSDPVLKNEYVAIGAHYDHVGIGAAVNADKIYNGADDDGSGTVAVLALAEAFARGPRPKRSLLFIWHAGEERGLWGSRHFTDFPTVPLNGIITQLNIDMIGRSKREGDTNPLNRELTGPNEIYVIGSKVMSTDLGELSDGVNKNYLNLTFNYRYDDPKDPNRFFFRSDHFNYARKNIPIIFYFDGVHEDYHRPSDSFDKIDYGKMERVARTVYVTAWMLGNAAKRPFVDKQLSPEFKKK